MPNTLNGCFEKFNLYHDFVAYYISAIIGLQHFEKEKCHTNYISYGTVSDEPFAIFITRK
jgi:hypothetical protein